jgi:hypothetical protein
MFIMIFVFISQAYHSGEDTGVAYHRRPLDAQNARPIPYPKAAGRKGEVATAGRGDRGAILAGAAVSPPGPQRIIAQK